MEASVVFSETCVVFLETNVAFLEVRILSVGSSVKRGTHVSRTHVKL